MPELRYDGRVAVITGAGRGLGRAYALLLGSRGAKVVVNDYGGSMFGEGTDAGVAQQVVDEIEANGGEAVASADSVGTPEGGRALVETALERFGRVDIVIHNAGISCRKSIKDISIEEFRNVLDVHLMGGLHVAHPAFPHMCNAGYGRIILTSSIAGLYGEKIMSPYATSKAGLIGLAYALAHEGAAEGVHCNLIIPAAVTRLSEGRDTSAFPPMTPEMVAPAVAWLAHESCTLNGEMLVSLAGRVAKAFVVETQGVYQPSWTIEDIAARMNAISEADETVRFPALPSGFNDHLGYSFAMAKGAAESPAEAATES
jgi:NAD(P)-dependent dehydrogenase (short-subunit alcohol dehydrogenase family)